MAHHCHATGCTTPVPPEMFSCRSHWYSLPKVLRDRILATYRKGQCDDWRPSPDYCEAAKAAVIYLANVDRVEPDTRIYDMFLASMEE